jgi:hypothetical protein
MPTHLKCTGAGPSVGEVHTVRVGARLYGVEVLAAYAGGLRDRGVGGISFGRRWCVGRGYVSRKSALDAKSEFAGLPSAWKLKTRCCRRQILRDSTDISADGYPRAS